MIFGKLLIAALGVCLYVGTLAQTLTSFEETALLFSRTQFGGSSRIQALGGAQVSLGGDYSSALSNPAGLGMFNRSEFTFSPGLNFYDSDTEYQGTHKTDSKTILNLPGLSYVVYKPKDENGFLGGSIGISLTRTNDLNSIFQYQGKSLISIVDYFLDQANGYNVNELDLDFPLGQAWDTGLISDSASQYSGSPDYLYFSPVGTFPDDPNDIRTVERSENVVSRGAQYQWSFAYGGNYKDKLFFGGALGIATLRYKFHKEYRETDFIFALDSAYNPLNYLNSAEYINIDGAGLNFTLGIIFRPIDFVQVGATLVTPTRYQLTDTYTSSVETLWNPAGFFESSTQEPIVSEYSLTTPLKFATGVTFFLSKYGFITGDIEFQNYGRTKYDSDIEGVSYSENNNIRALYTNTVNYRIGAEFRYEIFRLRGGYSIMNNPYKADISIDDKNESWSGGIGFKTKEFFADFALISNSGKKSTYAPFVFNDGSAPLVKVIQKVTRSMITVGFTF